MKKKILVIRFSSLGDVVLTTALFPSLKAEWPESEVVVCTKTIYAPVFQGNPWIDRVMSFDPVEHRFHELAKSIRKERFDMIFDLHGNLRSWFLRVVAGPPLVLVTEKASLSRWMLVLFKRWSPSLNFSVRERVLDCLKKLGLPVVDKNTHLFPANAEAVLSRYRLTNDQILIGLAPGAKHATKRWSADRYADLANRLARMHQATVVLLGDTHDQKVGETITRRLDVPFVNLIGQTSLSDLMAITSRLQLLITNDSGLLHMGEAFRIPLVSIFGPTVRGLGFAPYQPSSRLVEVPDLTCRPCTLHGDDACPLKHHACMDRISVEMVEEAARSVWMLKSDKMDVT